MPQKQDWEILCLVQLHEPLLALPATLWSLGLMIHHFNQSPAGTLNDLSAFVKVTEMICLGIFFCLYNRIRINQTTHPPSGFLRAGCWVVLQKSTQLCRLTPQFMFPNTAVLYSFCPFYSPQQPIFMPPILPSKPSSFIIAKK